MQNVRRGVSGTHSPVETEMDFWKDSLSSLPFPDPGQLKRLVTVC